VRTTKQFISNLKTAEIYFSYGDMLYNIVNVFDIHMQQLRLIKI